jgi:tetratricopeptide (TPR) repeat protein
VVRVVLALFAIGVCLLLMQSAARIGFSRLLSRYAIGANSLAAADQAIQLTPSDAEAHRARATVLNRLHRPAEAKVSLETATSLRSQHATLWLELGATREELGETEAALAAFDQAVRYAPNYAETHWQRGNLLLRIGRHDEAFADLRAAARSNPKFLPNVIDLAWGITGGVASATEKLLQIDNDADRLAFAHFLATKGEGADVAEQVRLLNGRLSEENKNELVHLLARSRRFGEAFGLWQANARSERVVNGGFEEPLVFDKGYFRWVLSREQSGAKPAVDVAEKFSGERSLQVTFNGDWDVNTALLAQTIVVSPGQRYRLSFALKTKDLVTGGPLRIVLTDAMNEQILATSETFPQSTGSWQQLHVEFTPPPGAEAIVVSLKRENCASAPCPIFGTIWLDEFALQKL